MTDKAALRRACRALAVPDDAASDAICDRILAAPEFARAECVFAFHPMRTEPNIRRVLETVLWTGRTLLLPRCGAAGEMRALVVRSMDELVQDGSFGLFQPRADAPEGLPDLVLVPAVAFDLAGYRLGHGGGYYDRYLSRYSGASLGVCFEKMLLERVPREAHDRPVAAVVTECRVLRPDPTKGGLPDGRSV